MSRDEFLVAKGFIFADVEREIQLARVDPAALRALGVRPGGGNFLAALGLLCYTEFGGKLRFNVKRPMAAMSRRRTLTSFSIFLARSIGRSARSTTSTTSLGAVWLTNTTLRRAAPLLCWSMGPVLGLGSTRPAAISSWWRVIVET